MLLSFALAALTAFSFQDCVPARWAPTDVESLRLLTDSAVTCIVVEEPAWNEAFVKAAHDKGVRVLASLPTKETEATAKRALDAKVDALYAEAISDKDLIARLDATAAAAGTSVAWLPERVHMPLAESTAGKSRGMLGTYQGLWAGVKLGHEGEAEAAPSGPPWIDTNSGFLRFLRTIAPPATPIWIANRPPTDRYTPATRYLQGIGDAAMAGAHWVVSLDGDLWKAMVAGDQKALDTWKRINTLLRFYKQKNVYTQLPDYSNLAIVQDINSGALVSGSVLDMVESKHIPAIVITPASLPSAKDHKVKLMLNIDPQSLTDAQREEVRGTARRGAMVLNGPPQWKISLPPPEAITFTEDQLKQLDDIWKEINRVIGRENFAVRIFGAPAMLSNLKAAPNSSERVLHLVNYSDYPVEGITVHTVERIKSAVLLTPNGEFQPEVYDYEEGSGIDIDEVNEAAILVLRP